MGIIMVYKPTYTWGAPVKGKTMGKKNKNISDSKVEGGAGRLGQTRAEPGNTFMGCWKTMGKC